MRRRIAISALLTLGIAGLVGAAFLVQLKNGWTTEYCRTPRADDYSGLVVARRLSVPVPFAAVVIEQDLAPCSEAIVSLHVTTDANGSFSFITSRRPKLRVHIAYNGCTTDFSEDETWKGSGGAMVFHLDC